MLDKLKRTEASGDNVEFDGFQQEFSVSFDYPVCFTRDVFESGNALLADVVDRRGEGRRHRAVVYLDQGVAESHPHLAGQVREYFHEHRDVLELACPPQVIVGGEAAKTSWKVVRDVLTTIGNLHLDRQSYVIVIGGGSVLDMVGFAASIVHRGLRLIRIPSTTLAQADAGIGVKNGMDEHGQKNFVGTFAPPFAVLNDFSLLATLSERDWLGGVAEAFKVALVKDAAFFDDLCDWAPILEKRGQEEMESVIRRCAILHLEHIRDNGDPFEFGSARPLDFGHWAGHRLEVMSNYQLGHGQGVSIGIALDSYYAMHLGLITRADCERICQGLVAAGLPIWSDLLTWRDGDGRLEVLEGLRQFREHLGGILNITLPSPIGEKVEIHDMDTAVIEEAIGFLSATSLSD